jgi:putative MATE family efflux protein
MHRHLAPRVCVHRRDHVPNTRRRRILALALPIVGGMTSQNILNVVDTAMVGSLGTVALAAVGFAGMANFMSQAFLTGLGTGVQAMVARRKGEGDEDNLARPLNGGLLLALVIGIPLATVMFYLAALIFPYLHQDPEVVRLGVEYWQVRILGMIAVGMNFAFRGYWNGVNLSRLYLRTLVVMHACNLFLNWVLIFGHLGMPALGSTGAGIGTTISTWIGTIYYFMLARAHARDAGFLRRRPDRSLLRAMWRLSLPSCLQTLFFAAGYTVLYWIIGKVGTTATGAANVIINVTMVAVLPGIGLGLAAASLVGQALGKGDPEDARRWGWDVVRIGALLMVALGLPMLLVPDLVLGIFLHEPEAIEMARLPLRLVGGTIAIDAVGMILLNALMGAGDTRRVMVVSVALQWAVFLPAAYIVGPVLGYGLLGIWIAQLCYRALLAISMASLWQRGTWTTIKI